MQKIIFILLIVSLVLITGCSTEAIEEDTFETECPHGLVNDPYPGKCGLYMDKDSNQICDYSEPKADSR